MSVPFCAPAYCLLISFIDEQWTTEPLTGAQQSAPPAASEEPTLSLQDALLMTIQELPDLFISGSHGMTTMTVKFPPENTLVEHWAQVGFDNLLTLYWSPNVFANNKPASMQDLSLLDNLFSSVSANASSSTPMPAMASSSSTTPAFALRELSWLDPCTPLFEAWDKGTNTLGTMTYLVLIQAKCGPETSITMTALAPGPAACAHSEACTEMSSLIPYSRKRLNLSEES
ncbi:hypothetical protein P7C70_g5079, partial [Phenoliferia sp. Uapishka_3]